ncbi:MAG: thioredoxin domain-containing protein [Gemmatimonadaceae bacterium]
MRRISADSVLLAVLAACAITTTGLVVRRTFVDVHPTTQRDSMIPHWRTITRGGESEGSTTSAATLIVFSDFQCPYCKNFAAVVDSIHANFPKVHIIERSFPLTSIHPRALDAAIAAACAGSAGKYWAFRHVIFNGPDLAQITSWVTPAQAAGV